MVTKNLKTRLLDDSWQVSQDQIAIETSLEYKTALETVNESIIWVDAVINRLKSTPWPGVENLLENRSSRAIKEAEIYLTSALESLEKAKRRLESTDE
jgi:hypothetical protein